MAGLGPVPIPLLDPVLVQMLVPVLVQLRDLRQRSFELCRGPAADSLPQVEFARLFGIASSVADARDSLRAFPYVWATMVTNERVRVVLPGGDDFRQIGAEVRAFGVVPEILVSLLPGLQTGVR